LDRAAVAVDGFGFRRGLLKVFRKIPDGSNQVMAVSDF
jgi:hypothetical protein